MTKKEAVNILKRTFVELTCELLKRKMYGEDTNLMTILDALEIAISTLEEQVEE